jgi:hypothetical protein
MTIVSQLLKEQYDLVEEYANAQSRLLNATIVSSPSSGDDDQLSGALENLHSCRCRVRTTMDQLQRDDEIRQRHSAHVTLSRRVIQTIAQNPSYYSNGIPGHTKSTLEANTVALATLKASISRICELESS